MGTMGAVRIMGIMGMPRTVELNRVEELSKVVAPSKAAALKTVAMARSSMTPNWMTTTAVRMVAAPTTMAAAMAR